MSHTIPAIFDAGVFRPLEPIDLADGTRVDVQLPESVGDRPNEVGGLPAPPIAWSTFVEQTYGSCAGLGLERAAQGDFEPREPVA